MGYQISDDLKEIDSEEFVRNSDGKTRENGAVKIRYSTNFRAQLVKEGRYLKCLRRDYRPGDYTCAKEKNLSYEEAKAILAKKVKIKENIVEKD